ncbi:MAG: copper resistance protein B [Robiginitomaculum sp.]
MRHLILKYVFISLLAVGLTVPASADEDGKTTGEKPWSMADQYYGAKAMAKSRAHMQKSEGGTPIFFIIADRLETQITNGEDAFVWDMQSWHGTDENKLWIKTEGEYSFDADKVEDANVQALWSKPISPFWDMQAGLRYDFAPKGRTHAVLGVQGLAPYWFEVDATAFLSTKGDVTARIEAEYDFTLTQRLMLQPRAEVEFSAQDIKDLNLGAGLTNLVLGLRLRYDLKREFSPYMGVEWQQTLGETASMAKTSGNARDKAVFLAGIRAWY